MFYKVCILAAGMGSRMSSITHGMNKALTPIGEKPAISHIIEKFTKELEIVIAVGYRAQSLKDYLLCAHDDRHITFVDVDNFDRSGAGPGYSLLQCKDHLNCPFIFYAVDTLVEEPIPAPDKNWLGVAQVLNPEFYCTVEVQTNIIVSLLDKALTLNKQAFIGLAGVRDYEAFFSGLVASRRQTAEEFQVSGGFSALIGLSLYPLGFKWYDVGNPDGYAEACREYSMNTTAFDFSKPDELIYFVGGKVIKYFENATITENRHLRAKQLGGLVPKITHRRGSFYGYDRVEGRVLYEVATPEKVSHLLRWLDSHLWRRKNLAIEEHNAFVQSCFNFYHKKTVDRVNKYHDKFGIVDRNTIINGVAVECLSALLAKIDWDVLCCGIASEFHGDLQFDNILEKVAGDFVLLDWRQDFSGNITFGDLYYDLAKLNGGMLVSYAMIKKGEFGYSCNSEERNDIVISHNPGEVLSDCRRAFQKFIRGKLLDLKRVDILTSLIFLNMAVMHHPPFAHFLYNLGKMRLQNALETTSNSEPT